MFLLPMISHWIPVIASAISSNCSDQFASTVNGGLQTVIQILMALGVVIAVVGIIAGGLMRTHPGWPGGMSRGEL